MNQIIIGLCGRKQSGKTAAANMLEASGFKRLSFAEPIRDMLWVLLYQCGYDHKHIESILRIDKEEPVMSIGQSPRQLMQSLGTEWGRDKVNSSLWLIAARRRIANLGAYPIVFDDVRFENEAQFIRGYGGLIINVDRQAANTDFDSHASETGIMLHPADVTVLNDGPLPGFLADISSVVQAFRLKNECHDPISAPPPEVHHKTVPELMGWVE